jgi:hypothetical protein
VLGVGVDLWSQKNKMCPTILVTFITNTQTHTRTHEHKHARINMLHFTNHYLFILEGYVATELKLLSTTQQKERN